MIRAERQNNTIGFVHQEWVIRPGARLYVRGEASDATGRLAFAKPEHGDYMISTRSEEQIVAQARSRAKVATTVAQVAGILGTTLALAGLVAG